ncbi:MAG: hypothetical protein EA381_17670 [Planctomycetaceae bacterium]|nr:MAG: hypothetical protein EA381_17670 [Planctomycetaceae bacterium]
MLPMEDTRRTGHEDEEDGAWLHNEMARARKRLAASTQIRRKVEAGGSPAAWRLEPSAVVSWGSA